MRNLLADATSSAQNKKNPSQTIAEKVFHHSHGSPHLQWRLSSRFLPLKAHDGGYINT